MLAGLGAGQTIDVIAQEKDPRRPFVYTQEEADQFQVAMPLGGPWYWGDPNLGPASYYNPQTYPHALINPFLPRWSGAFIQPRNVDPLVVVEGQPGMDDPTGGDYWASAGPLGPGEDIGWASQWGGDVKPHGFASAAIHP